MREALKTPYSANARVAASSSLSRVSEASGGIRRCYGVRHQVPSPSILRGVLRPWWMTAILRRSPADEGGVMPQSGYDAIVVGARCAGSPTAMLLARKGYDVLVVDRATFPSDTLSTHILHPPGVAAMKRWGLLDQLTATSCPPIDTYTFDFGPLVLSGAPGTDDSPVAYCPRRTVLDQILVNGASEAGAEVREEFTVEDVVVADGRVTGLRGHG